MYYPYLMDEHHRSSDSEIHEIREDVGKLKATVHSHGEAIANLGRDIGRAEHRLGESIGKLGTDIAALRESVDSKTRAPMLPHITMLIVAGGFLLTIMSLLFNQISAKQDKMDHDLAEHQDGHPTWVVQIIERIEERLSENIEAVDEKHAEEHREQEEDIGELRIGSQETNSTVNNNGNRISILETQMSERTAWIKSELSHRDILRNTAASDRWTATEERIKTEGHRQEHSHQDSRIKRLEDDHRQWGRTSSGHSGQ